jgi:nucleotide-binding universal stress UspA family protein
VANSKFSCRYAWNPILVPIDFSTPSLAALRQAVRYTQTVGGELLLLHVVEGTPLRWSAVDGPPEAPSAVLHSMAPLMLPQPPSTCVACDLVAEAEWKLAALLPPQPDRFRALVTVGRAADEIVRVARAQGADLIIMGTHGHRGFRRWFRKRVTDQVRRQAPTAVLTVGALRRCLEGDGDPDALFPAPGLAMPRKGGRPHGPYTRQEGTLCGGDHSHAQLPRGHAS